MIKVRIKIILVSLSILSATSIRAQDKTGFSELAKDFKTDFAVPDGPAFNLLKKTPSRILKPASVKEIGVGLSDFLDNAGNITLPNSFGLEFSPGLLINGRNLTLSEYKKKSWLYRLRLSVASVRSKETSSATELAFGTRVTLKDESDLRMNSDYITEAVALADAIQAIYDYYRKFPDDTPEEIEKIPDAAAKKAEAVDRFVEKWSAEKWNRSISELAFAVKAEARDSLAENLEFSRFAFWYSAAWGLGDWGQALFGFNVGYGKEDSTDQFLSSASIASRLYMGGNDYKFYLEAQAEWLKNKKPIWLFNSGFIMRIKDNLWGEYTAGMESGGGLKNRLVTGFVLKYGL